MNPRSMGYGNHEEPVRKIWAAFEFNFPLLFILNIPLRGAVLTINYPVPNPEHATSQLSTVGTLLKLDENRKRARYHGTLVL